MATQLKAVLGSIDGGREIRADDFSPWSYNLHFLSTNEPWTYRNHRHHGCFELVYVLQGTVEHRLDEQWRSFSQGDLLAVGEEDYHAIRGENFSYANLIIPVEYWESRVTELNLDDPLGSPRHCRGFTVAVPRLLTGEFEAILDRLFRYQQTVEGERQLRRMIAFLLYQVYWAELPDAEILDDSKDHPPWWIELVRRVESSSSIPENPQKLADIAGMSREHVARSCRRYLECSPSAWLNRLRLERAALQLRKTNRSISDIVFAMDFTNLPHFYRLFKDHFGMPPGEFRHRYGDVPTAEMSSH